MDCSEQDCADRKSHGILTCPVRLSKITSSNTKVIDNINVQSLNRMRAVALPTAMVLVESLLKDASLVYFYTFRHGGTTDPCIKECC